MALSDLAVYSEYAYSSMTEVLRQKIDLGLSPLTRGNPPQSVFLLGATGPIPAHAGEP